MKIELYIPDMEGCSDGNCIFKKNTGMVTNGGCQCAKKLQRTEAGWKAVRTINFLRSQMKDAYDCTRTAGCVCGGDTPKVRAGCGYYEGDQ